jgi:hypothetical protein
MSDEDEASVELSPEGLSNREVRQRLVLTSSME